VSIRAGSGSLRTRIARTAAASLLAWVALAFLPAGVTNAGVLLAATDPSEAAIAKEAATPEAGTSEANGQDPSSEPLVTTRHRMEVQGELLSYTATAGRLPLRFDGSHKANIFFVSYWRDETGIAIEDRPVTFVFNGGPGAASAYLHLGALGPQRLVFEEDGAIPPAPARLANNQETWLTFTDLVFVDPVGTGYSRRANGTSGTRSPFWETEQDIHSLAEFIRSYLTLNNRRLSPVFLAGESYGGFRAAALADTLTTDVGVGLNGVVLISPVLEFSLMYGDDYTVLPWALLLPAYAATALAHDRTNFAEDTAEDTVNEKENLAEIMKPVEAFSLNAYLIGLAEGDNLGAEARAGLYQQIARYTGLTEELVERYRGRIPREVFAKQVLASEARIVSLYDGAIAGIDPSPQSVRRTGHDPVLQGMTAPLTSTLVAYVRDDLGYQSDLRYELLNRTVFQAWQWRKDDRSQGYLGAADELKAAMSLNRHLKVLIAHGYYDLVTSYFASRYVVDQMALDPSIRANLTLATYRGGHMFYARTEARRRFAEDASAFYHSARDARAPEAGHLDPQSAIERMQATEKQAPEKHLQPLVPATHTIIQ
jgi:carboxypeptidase C (cathepsin A)